MEEKAKRCTVPRQLIEMILREVFGYKKSVCSVAQDPNLPKTTLLRYVRKHWSVNPEYLDIRIGHTKPRQDFNEDQEARRVKFISESAKVYFGLPPIEVRRFAYECGVSFKVASDYIH